MISVSSNLFYIAAHFTTRDKTRYYLQGVFVEPHERGGVTLCATDGAKLIAIYDPQGKGDESALVLLNHDMLSACRRAGGAGTDGRLVVDGPRATIMQSDIEVVSQGQWRCEGVFPDWRHVVPSKKLAPPLNGVAPCFSALVLSTFCQAAEMLEKHYGTWNAKSGARARIHLVWHDKSDPCLVLFPGLALDNDYAFGIAMPVSNKDPGDRVPSWAHAKG
jgi:hypothetical protein